MRQAFRIYSCPHEGEEMTGKDPIKRLFDLNRKENNGLLRRKKNN